MILNTFEFYFLIRIIGKLYIYVFYFIWNTMCYILILCHNIQNNLKIATTHTYNKFNIHNLGNR